MPTNERGGLDGRSAAGAGSVKLLHRHIERRHPLERQVLALPQERESTVGAIAECIYDGLAPLVMAAARGNIRAHLGKLRSEGNAFMRDGRWIPNVWSATLVLSEW